MIINSAALFIVIAAAALAFQRGRGRALELNAAAIKAGGRPARLSSPPSYYGYYLALWCALPALLFFAAWSMGESQMIGAWLKSEMARQIEPQNQAKISFYLSDIEKIARGETLSRTPETWLAALGEKLRRMREIADYALAAGVLATACAFGFLGARRITPRLKAAHSVDRLAIAVLWSAACLAVLVTLGIVLSLAFEAFLFFERVPFFDFIFGTHWSPQMSIRGDQIGSSGSFGALPVFAGTALITVIAMCVALPMGLLTAVYLAEYASIKQRLWIKPFLEILAGVPTVVYGFFAALTVAPLLRGMGVELGFHIDGESALAAGLVMGVMIIPFVSSLSDDALHAVPDQLRDSSLALGATQSETIRKVIIPAALPGIVSACLLAVSRAIGETMIVVMAAGLAANLTANPFSAVTTVTVQIVTLLIGDQEFASTTTLAAFALGLVLFFLTLVLNFIALHVARKFRERYE